MTAMCWWKLINQTTVAGALAMLVLLPMSTLSAVWFWSEERDVELSDIRRELELMRSERAAKEIS